MTASERAKDGEYGKVPNKATCQEPARENVKAHFVRKGGKRMESKNFMTVDEVAEELCVSYEYCFDGIEKHCVVAVGMIGCKAYGNNANSRSAKAKPQN